MFKEIKKIDPKVAMAQVRAGLMGQVQFARKISTAINVLIENQEKLIAMVENSTPIAEQIEDFQGTTDHREEVETETTSGASTVIVVEDLSGDPTINVIPPVVDDEKPTDATPKTEYVMGHDIPELSEKEKLQAICVERGIKFDKRWNVDTLKNKIAEKEAE